MAKPIGKAAVFLLLNLAFSNLHSQSCTDSVGKTPWPNFYQGDTQLFLRSNSRIVSNYSNPSKKVFKLIANCSEPNTSQFEISLKVGINLSSSNWLKIGFQLNDSTQSYALFGNVKDQWQWFQNDSLIASGMEKEFDVSSFQLQLLIHKYEDTLWLTMNNSSTGQKQRFRLCQNAANFNLHDCFIEIQQLGTSAISKHQFWNLKWSNYEPDTLPPQITSVKQTGNHNLQIQWNEAVSWPQTFASILKEGNLQLVNSNNDSNLWDCTFSLASNNIPDSLHVNFTLIYAKNGRTIENLNFNIPYTYLDTPRFGNLILTEIMHHPNNKITNAPNVNFVEITNMSKNNLDLGLLSIGDAVSRVQLPKAILKPFMSVVLCKSTDTPYFKRSMLGLSNFPYFNVSEDRVYLAGPLGVIADLEYSDDKTPEFAKEGGYSIQKLHKLWPTIEGENWDYMTNNASSPGYWNYEDSTQLPDSIQIIECYQRFDSVYVQFNQEIPRNPKVSVFIDQKKVPYTVVNSCNLKCFVGSSNPTNLLIMVGNQEYKSKIHACKSQTVQLRFNEVMYRSSENFPDYIEFVNVDSVPALLSDFNLWILNNDLGLRQIISLKNETKNLILPGEIVAICENRFKVKNFFHPQNPFSIVQIKGFPNLLSEGGYLQLWNFNSTVNVDQCSFNDKMHSPIYSELNDKSLEKMNPTLASYNTVNWGSALNSPEFGTPGSPNSNQNSPNNPNAQFGLDRKVWYFNDKNLQPLICEYSFPSSGFILKIQAFNSTGEFICTLLENTAMPQLGAVQIWPKCAGKFFDPENYILKFEALNSNGDLCRAVKRITVKYN